MIYIYNFTDELVLQTTIFATHFEYYNRNYFRQFCHLIISRHLEYYNGEGETLS